MWHETKPIYLTMSRFLAPGLAGPLAAGLLAIGPGMAAEGYAPFPWKAGLIEKSRYSIKLQGRQIGEIEQLLYGVQDKTGRKRYRCVVEVIREIEVVNQQPVLGRFTSEVFFGLESMEFDERVDNFARGDSEGRIRIVRTPTGLKISAESMSAGISRPASEETMDLQGGDLFVDQLVLSFFIRALPTEEGHTFSVTTVLPLEKTVERLRGQVGPLQQIQWNNRAVEVRRIEAGSPKGTGTYYVLTDPSHTLARFVSPQQQIYERQASLQESVRSR